MKKKKRKTFLVLFCLGESICQPPWDKHKPTRTLGSGSAIVFMNKRRRRRRRRRRKKESEVQWAKRKRKKEDGRCIMQLKLHSHSDWAVLVACGISGMDRPSVRRPRVVCFCFFFCFLVLLLATQWTGTTTTTAKRSKAKQHHKTRCYTVYI